MTDEPVIPNLPTIDDEPAGVFRSAASPSDEAMEQLARECRERGDHHLAKMEIPSEGLVITCTHCFAWWRAAT